MFSLKDYSIFPYQAFAWWWWVCYPELDFRNHEVSNPDTAWEKSTVQPSDKTAMMPSDDSLSVRDVSMCYPEPRRLRECLLRPSAVSRTTALQDITLTIKSGESVGLLGPNGSGKTTLLKLLGGLLYPTTGTVLINGRDTKSENLAARAPVGYVVNEDRSFYWRLSGRQNLEFFGVLENVCDKTLCQQIDRVLKLVELSSAAEKMVAAYSTGMRQRLAIARSLLTDPDFLILDEPTRSLDPQGTELFHRIMGHYAQQHPAKTLLIATHHFTEAEALCDRWLILARGRVAGETTRQGLREQGGSLASFYTSVMRVAEELPCC